jgi:hypothetical protein
MATKPRTRRQFMEEMQRLTQSPLTREMQRLTQSPLTREVQRLTQSPFTREVQRLMQSPFTREVQRLMRADPIARFLDGDMTETDPRPVKTDDVVANAATETETDPPSPSEQHPVQRRRRGPSPVYPREPLWELNEENPNRTIKELGKLYKARTEVEVKDTWVRTHRVRPRS